MRPFEKNDLVVSESHGSGEVTYIDSDCVRFLFLSCVSCVTYHNNYDDIKTIRKPRKGNAESRAIVAMLAIECRKALSVKKQDYESEFKRGARCKDKTSKLRLYEKAKSMLK